MKNCSRFLGIIQGLETLHRRAMKNDIVSPDEHRERIESILAAVPESYRDWVDGKLTFSDEPTLRARLRELLRPLGDLYGNSEARNRFIYSVVNTRNYLIHYDQELEGKVARGADLFYLYQKLSGLFLAHLLLLLGFDPEKITGLSTSNRHFRFLIHPA